METVEVADISVYREGALHSLWGQRLVKDGKLEEIGTGFGIVKGGKLYQFRAVVLSLEEAGVDSCLKVTFHLPMEECLARVQIRDANYPEWIDYERFVPENGKAVIRDRNDGSIASGTYRVVVTDMADCSETYSNEVTYETAIPLRLFCANHHVLTAGWGGGLFLGGSIKSENILYILQIFNERYGAWASTPYELEGTGEPMEWPILTPGKYRLVGENIETGDVFYSNVVMIKYVERLVLYDTDPQGDIYDSNWNRQLTRKEGGGYEDFNFSFAIGGENGLYNRVILRRFELSLREWQEVQAQDIVMDSQDYNPSLVGTFTVNVPGHYRAEAVNTGTGAKTESNFVVFSDPG